MDFSKRIDFNHIIILDLLREDDFQTARRLDDNISVFVHANQRTHIKISSKENLIENLMLIIQKKLPEGIKPIIHIEGHGSEISLSLPDGSSISWFELYEILSKINFYLNNTLILFIATCYGYHYIKTLKLQASTPTFCLISPSEKIDSCAIERGAYIFYKNIFETKDLDISIRKLTKSDSSFDFYNSDQFFIELMTSYFKKWHYGKLARERIDSLLDSTFTKDEEEGYKYSKNKRKAVLSERRKLAKKFIKSEESRYDIYKRNSLIFLGYYNKAIFKEIIKKIESEINFKNN